MNLRSRLMLLVIPVSYYCACMHHPGQSFTEQSYILKKQESIRIPELDLQISNKGCGRQWMTNNGGEKPFCDLELKATDTVLHFGSSFQPVYYKNLELMVTHMNPWNVTEDSIPAGGCRIWIRKLPDTAR